MLMGTLHLLHGAGATGIIEAKHPNSIFVISELGVFGENSTDASKALLASWPIPSLVRVKGSPLGRLDLKTFLPPPYVVDQNCNPHADFTGPLRKPVEELFDAVLYLGPQDLRLWEKIPADIVLDADYKKELRRRATLPGSPTPAVQTSDELDRQIFERAENPLGEKFPQAQFVVTGVLGPHSNAHGPNEFLHLPTGQRVTRVIAQVLADHAARRV